MASHLVERGIPLRIHEVPFELPVATVELRWHQRVDDDPASQWLRTALTSVANELRAR